MNQYELRLFGAKLSSSVAANTFAAPLETTACCFWNARRRMSRFSEKVNPFSTSSPVILDGSTARLCGRRAHTFPLFRSLMVWPLPQKRFGQPSII